MDIDGDGLCDALTELLAQLDFDGEIDDCPSNGSDYLFYDADGNDVGDSNLGGYDMCGRCNGEGAIYECLNGEYVETGGCYDISDLSAFACDCSGNVLDECGVCGGNNYFDTNGLLPNGECDCNSISGSDTNDDGIIDDFEPHVLDCNGECDGDRVDIDDDGICDELDDCVSNGTEYLIYDIDGNEETDPNLGGYDTCGICNGENYYDDGGFLPDGTCDCNGSFPPAYDCDCNGNAFDECGVCAMVVVLMLMEMVNVHLPH
jgi:hypothetical protein